MSKIRVLPDHISNLIAAGEVVERPASVAKELVENAIDAGATRILIDVEAGGRRLLKITDDGEGMVRDDAILAFERHATSKISKAEDLNAISTLGFRGEALASIASVAKVELISSTAEASAGTRVVIEGGRLRDVKDAAHPRGTTIGVRDLFFNTPARRKFLRSEATESYHLTNLATHYALAHPEIAFTLTNNGRETLRVAPAQDLRERAYQVFGAQFLDGLLVVNNDPEGAAQFPQMARIRGFVSAPRERRTSRDAQFLFVNGRFVRDRLIGRALSEGYRSILPHGVYPVALLFIDVPLEEVDVNVHPAKTEVRFRRAAAVADAVREAVRVGLASAGYVAAGETRDATAVDDVGSDMEESTAAIETTTEPINAARPTQSFELRAAPQQERIGFVAPAATATEISSSGTTELTTGAAPARAIHAVEADREELRAAIQFPQTATELKAFPDLPPLDSAIKFVREVAVETLSSNIRPLGQLDESFIIATDDEGLLLI